jgi:(p)ppGpp synthase/HD superfamily hydrolase
MHSSGYSDRINHALAFAAKHNDRQVLRGTRQPYRAHASTVAIILTRYDRDDDTVIAGILQDVVADCVSDRTSPETLEQRVGQKFGSHVLQSVLSITPRRVDESGVDFSHDERRDDLLERLQQADDRARWVVAAEALYVVGGKLADLRRTIDPDSVWSQTPLGREGTVQWYRAICERLKAIGFTAPIVEELSDAIEELSAPIAR